jgi:hypothetical protein
MVLIARMVLLQYHRLDAIPRCRSLRACSDMIYCDFVLGGGLLFWTLDRVQYHLATKAHRVAAVRVKSYLLVPN